jgi:hypothetical protein
VINVYQPALSMEEFFREVGKFNGKPAAHEALGLDGLHALFKKHGMDITGPPLIGEWKVTDDGKILRLK